MNAFAKLSVLAVILGVAMSGTTAKADFNNQQVKELAFTADLFARGLLEGIREIGLPRVQQLFFRQRLNSIRQNAVQIFELADSGSPDNQVEDEILALAEDSRNKAQQMVDRAEDLNNDDLVEAMEQVFDVTDQLVDLVD